MSFAKESNLQSIQKTAIAFLNLPLERDAFGGYVFLQHPFFNSAFVIENHNGQTEFVDITKDEKAYQRQISEMTDRIRERDLFGIWNMMLVKYHLTFLKYIKPYLSRKDFSTLLADAWVTSENPNQDVNVSVRTAASWFRQADKRFLMEADEFDVWQKLPDTFQIYRGVAVGRNPRGLSWTQNIKTAEWFAHRFDTETAQGYIQTATIERKRALAYFNGRGEDELVVDPSNLFIQSISSI